MKRFALISLTLLPFGLSARLLFTPAVYDFGSFPETDAPEATFTLSNIGQTPITIDEIIRTCGCSEASVDQTHIPAGETATLRLRLEPLTLNGPFAKSLFLRTTPPQTPMTTLAFTGNSLPRFRILPSKSINLGHIASEASPTARFTLLPAASDVTLQTPRLEGPPQAGFSVTTNSQTQAITVEITPIFHALPSGSHAWTLHLPTQENDPYPIQLQTFAQTGFRLACAPRSININPTETPFSSTIYLRIPRSRTHTITKQAITVSDLPPGVEITPGEVMTPRGFPLKLSTRPEKLIPAENAYLVLFSVADIGSCSFQITVEAKKETP